MQLGDPGLELERAYVTERTKPLNVDERALLEHIFKREGNYPPWPKPYLKNPDNPLRCTWCPWYGKDIINTRDVFNRYQAPLIARNKDRSQDFAREVLIHLGFELPDIIEREKVAMGMEGLDQVELPTTERLDILTTQQPARTLAPETQVRPQQQDMAALIPWALLALSIFRTFRG